MELLRKGIGEKRKERTKGYRMNECRNAKMQISFSFLLHEQYFFPAQIILLTMKYRSNTNQNKFIHVIPISLLSNPSFSIYFYLFGRR